MLNRYVFLSLAAFSTFSFAKNYSIDLISDENSIKYLSSIKKEAKTLFPSVDKITYNIKQCTKDCKNYFNKKNSFILLKTSKKHESKNKNAFLTYNHISSIYDENRLIRMSALTIYELIKEQKANYVYLESKALIKEVKKNTNIKVLNLKDVFSLAKQNNLDIKQNLNSIKIEDINIEEAKSSYKPSIDIYSNYVRIDKDRAKYSNGQTSQGSLDAGVKLTQLIYSDKVLQNIKIRKLFLESTKAEVKALNDEVMYKSTILYLNILKAKKANQITKIKKDFIEQNLNFAKQRVDIGVQDRSDIFRWQSELANVNIDLANSKRDLNSLKIELSNLLQITGDFETYEYSLNSSLFKLNNKDAIKYIEDKRVQNSFSNNIVHTHTRLKQINLLKDVKQEELQMNQRSRYLPTIAFEGNTKRVLDRYDEGANAQRAWDDNEYEAVLNINIPIYEGGVKSTNIQKNKIELINLKLQYSNTKNLIIENVRKNFESLKRSYEKIRFAKVSQESSRKNFELIQDKYKNGSENIISLLDAQDAYIISKLNLNISNIEYLSDLSSIYFFSGKIDILVNEQNKKEVEKNIINIIKGTNK